jgi:hypothetical protein
MSCLARNEVYTASEGGGPQACNKARVRSVRVLFTG